MNRGGVVGVHRSIGVFFFSIQVYCCITCARGLRTQALPTIHPYLATTVLFSVSRAANRNGSPPANNSGTYMCSLRQQNAAASILQLQGMQPYHRWNLSRPSNPFHRSRGRTWRVRTRQLPVLSRSFCRKQNSRPHRLSRGNAFICAFFLGSEAGRSLSLSLSPSPRPFSVRMYRNVCLRLFLSHPRLTFSSASLLSMLMRTFLALVLRLTIGGWRIASRSAL